MKGMTTEQIQRRLVDATMRTATGLAEMAACVVELESRGVDLSHLKLAILPYLRLIASGQLLPDIVVRYAGQQRLLSAAAKIPLADQAVLLETGRVRIAVMEKDRSIGFREVDPRALTPHEINRVFSSDGILPAEKQIVEPRPKRKVRRLYFDGRTRMLHIAKTQVPLGEVLAALAEAGGRQGDIPLTDVNSPSVGARLTHEERERLRAACKAHRLEESEFVRRAILTWLI